MGNRKTVLMTGATGFIGSHLVKKMLDQDYQVAVLKRSFSSTTRIDQYLPDILEYNIDQCDVRQPFQDLEEVDAVIHLATATGRCQESVEEIFEANTAFPLKLLNIAKEFQVSVFISTDTYINKSNLIYPSLREYSLSKRHFQQWGQYIASLSNIKFLNVKLEYVFGSGDYRDKLIPSAINHFLRDSPNFALTSGEQERDFIHVDDVVEAYATLIDKSKKIQQYYKEFEVGTGEAIPLKRVIRSLRDMTNAKTEVCFGNLPQRPGEIMSSKADRRSMEELGWSPSKNLKERLIQTIEEER